MPLVTDKPIYGPLAVQSLNLRGGGLDDDEMELVLSDIDEEDMGLSISEMDDESSELWERQANDQLALSLRGGAEEIDVDDEERETHILYGREGNIECGFELEELISSICTLLRVVDASGAVEVAVDLFQRDSKGVFVYLNTVLGPIYPGVENEAENNDCIVWLHLKNQMTARYRNAGRVAFVRLSTDSRPTTPEPPVRQDGLARLCHDDGYRQMISYMRTPSRPTDCHSPTQYASEYIRTLNGLLPPILHEYIAMTHASSRKKYTSGPLYPRQDPDSEFIEGVATIFDKGSDPTFVLETTKPISPDHVPILLSAATDITLATGFAPLEMEKRTIASHKSLATVVDHVISSSSPGAKKTIESMQVWVPAEVFQLGGGPHPSAESVIIPLENGTATKEGVRRWLSAIKRLAKDVLELYQNGFAVVVRPVYNTYRFHATSSSMNISVPSLTIDLKSFKAMVASGVYPGTYNPADKKHVLLLSQTGAIVPHPIRFDTTESKWTQYLQRISEPMVAIELAVGSEGEKMERDTRWGK
jgi:hypothetical protein